MAAFISWCLILVLLRIILPFVILDVLFFFELGLIGYGQGLVIFHKMGPMTRHDYLQQNDCL